ncbi:protein GPR108 [Chanos chanos]|uniref:Protein GPR108 n=1 Tax=Chanos chanos TaxID=29144 RepID=A0A6J2VUS4_CHACN|nr:protein GPR108-like [Chanos chanos]
MVLNRVVYLAACLVLFEACFSHARIHHLTLKNETRFLVHLNTFGYFTNATLDVQLVSVRLPQHNLKKNLVGFSLAKSRVNGILSYTAEESECTLTKNNSAEPLILFILDTQSLSVRVKSFGIEDSMLKAEFKTAENTKAAKGTRRKRDKHNNGQAPEPTVKGPAPHTGAKTTEPIHTTVRKDETGTTKAAKDTRTQPSQTQAKAEDKKEHQMKVTNGMQLVLHKHNDVYNFSFQITIGALSQGLYNLDFHHCGNREPGAVMPYDLNVQIVEKNLEGFLSASDIPLPRLYLCMAGIFLTAAVVWVHTLMKHRYSVFKIHWLMAALAFTKSVSLLFHSINYHFINKEGHPIEGWAVMYYITHLLKGALLFITLALIGTGFAFVKYILSDKEKKIFMIVIPLQVLANVAYIIIEETEEGSSEYALWREILFLVDLICCGAILFPVVWSIRHLQEASTTDGKAAMNLEKLKLFRHYYVMIVCYIYFTRIIAILLRVTVPFQWQWCQEFLVEVSTLIFFVLTGFKFRPASNNPYLQLPQDEEDMEMDEVVTESGVLEGISKVKKTLNGRERQRDAAL